MLKQERNERARACDTCRSRTSSVYCHADSAYLCTSCDAQVHSANRVASRHKRVPVCESCERSPAAFMCEADDASLCTACDSEVHSANPLARRHQRVPVLPISGHSCSSSMAKEAASWLFPPNSDKNTSGDHNNVFLFSDEYLDLVDYKSTAQYNQHQQDCSVPHGGDGVVPLQLEESRRQVRHKQQNFRSGFTFDSSASHYSYNGGSIKHDAYNSAMETDFVPDSTASFPIQMLSPMDREARVLRYREKKKTRKFEKTIRYASRKAYAETRPRINGRFAKRGEIEAEEQGFSTGYGIVPSF